MNSGYATLMEQCWYCNTEVLIGKLVPVPLGPPQIPHGLAWDWTRASSVGGRRLFMLRAIGYFVLLYLKVDFHKHVARLLYTQMRTDLFVDVMSLLGPSCLPLTIPYPLHAENECNSSKVSAAARSNSKSTDSWVGIARGRHHQRHLAVGVHSLIKPIKPSHFRAAVSNPVSEGFEKCHKLKKREARGDGSWGE